MPIAHPALRAPGLLQRVTTAIFEPRHVLHSGREREETAVVGVCFPEPGRGPLEERAMTCVTRVVILALSLALYGSVVGAQTVTSTTGAINGTVTDSTKAVLPGVTVNLSGAALMGVGTAVTDSNGFFRLSTVPVGDYTLTFELPGFGTVVREGIHIAVGFTATVNVEMNPASVAETITVSGASPVVDARATTLASHFDSQQLNELTGSRDAWTVISMAPAVAMSRLDVGGSDAWTQQAYKAYGIGGGERNEVEGMLVNEGAGQMYYTDFGSFQEISVTPVGNTAEVGTPGIYSNFVSKSGSNQFHGNVYFDYEKDSLEAHNIDAAQIALGIMGSQYLDVHDLNRLSLYRDLTADIGGYAKKDKAWWYFSYRDNVSDLRFPTLVDDVQHTSGPVYSGKVNINLSQNRQLIGYYQHAGKVQPDYLGAIALPSGRTTPAIMHANTVWHSIYPNDTFKVEFNGTLTNSLLLAVRAGGWFSDWARTGKSDAPRIEDIGNDFVSGGVYGTENIRKRPQANGALSYFKSGWGGTHNLKVGGEFLLDILNQPFPGFTSPCQCVSVFNNGVPNSVYLFQGPETSRNGLWAYTGYASDSWQVKTRLTLNLGLRLDRYRPFLPAQQGPNGQNYPAVDDILAWNLLSPRLGFTYDLKGNGKTVLKANYGKYFLYPAADFSTNVNPNPNGWYQQYTWTDVNGNGIWDPGEQGRLISTLGGAAATTFDSAMQDTFQHQLMMFVEREAAPGLALRTGFVWKGVRQTYGQVNVNRPLSAYNVPVTIQDPGPDGIHGGGTFTAYNLSAAALSLPVVNITENLANTNGNYYTWELTAVRRQSAGWSMLATFAETWSDAAALGTGSSYTPNALINASNAGNFQNSFKTWQGKVQATLELPWQLRLVPLVRYQAGNPFARTFSQRLNYGNATIMAEPFGTERAPNQTLFDLRSEKVFRLGGSVKVTALLDLYNIFNTNVAQDVTITSGSSFLRPVAITPPRVARVGFKFNW
jgi:hypothetical protein